MPDQKERRASSPKGKQRQVVIHPFLFAINAILFFYLEACAYIDAWAILRSITLSILGVAALWIALRSWLGDLRKAALITSLASILFFAHGVIIWQLADMGWFPADDWGAGAHVVLWAAMLVLLGSIATVCRTRRLDSDWTYFANVFGTAAVVIPLMLLVQQWNVTNAMEKTIRLTHASIPTAGKEAVQEPPDIYWILPDAYARADILADFFNFDNKPFLEDLRERGFTIAPEAVSSYSTTALSVASILNIDYMQNLIDGSIEDSPNWWLSRRLVNENRVGRFLKERGYTTYTVATQYDNISWRSDNRVSRWWFLNYFEANLLFRTPIQPISRMLGMSLLHEHHRARTRFTYDWVAKAAKLEGPKFVFVQLVTPHAPFIFGPQGESVTPRWRYTWAEGQDFHLLQEGATKQDYLEGYRNQVQYSNQRLIETVDRIQARSKQPPVIVVMSDHGPLSGEWQEDLSRPEVIERFGVLSALSLPGGDSDQVPADLNAVNTFRLILNEYFDTKLDFLESRSYYINGLRPNQYIPIDFGAGSNSATINDSAPPTGSFSKASLRLD